MRLWVIAILLIPVAASASMEPGIRDPSGPSSVDLWTHCPVVGRDCILHTETPQDHHQQTAAVGIWPVSQRCTPIPAVPLANAWTQTYAARIFSTTVDYAIDEGGRPYYHPIDALAHDVALAGDMGLRWYLLADVAGQDGAAPQVHVQASLREGAEPMLSADPREGALIAAGATGPVDLHPWTDSSGVEVFDVDGRSVYGIDVPMERLADHIPERSATLLVDVTMEVPACDGFMPNTVRSWNQDGLYGRLHLNLLQPLWIERLDAKVVDADVLITASVRSPWGAHDVGPLDAASLRIDAPGDAVLVSHVVRSHEHDHTRDPVRASWSWRPPSDAGPTRAHLTVTNLQGTAQAEATVAFDWSSGTGMVCDDGCLRLQAEPPEQTTPLPTWPLLAMGVLAAALGARHRDNS